MKTRILSIVLMSSATFMIGCGQTSTKTATEEVKMMSVDEMKTPTMLAVKIEGMS